MKRQAKAAGLGLLLLVGLAGCGTGGPGGGQTTNPPPSSPSYNQAQFDQAWQQHQDKLRNSVTDLASDPAIRKLFPQLGSVWPLSSMPSSTVSQGLENLASALLKGLGLEGAFTGEGKGFFPLSTQSQPLPRGGEDYTTSPPSSYTPLPPYDYGQKGWTQDRQSVAELLVDWDYQQRPTLWVYNKMSTPVEVPQSSAALLRLDGTQSGEATLTASWYQCPQDRRSILEPTSISLRGQLGQNKKLVWDSGFTLTEGATDEAKLDASLSTQGVNPSAKLALSLSLVGDWRRGQDCFTQAFKVQQASLNLSSEVGGDRLAFELRVLQVTYQGNDPVRLDLRGNITHNGQRAVNIEGYLEASEFSGPNACPGRYVTLAFADRTLTLEEWLRSEGLCPSPNP